MIKSPFSLSVFAAMLLQLPPNWCCQWPSLFNMNEVSVKWKELPRQACMPSTGLWNIQISFFFIIKLGGGGDRIATLLFDSSSYSYEKMLILRGDHHSPQEQNKFVVLYFVRDCYLGCIKK